MGWWKWNGFNPKFDNFSSILYRPTKWNNLPAQIRNSPSISCFKRRLLDSYFNSSIVPKYYLHDIRNLSVIHTRFRNNCSNLNADLFNNHISLTDKCEHCQISENAEHYFFSCKKYSEQRIQLFNATRNLHPLSTKLLLFGDSGLSHHENVQIVEAVHQFIKSTKRFQ